jgi:hypothetical protein
MEDEIRERSPRLPVREHRCGACIGRSALAGCLLLSALRTQVAGRRLSDLGAERLAAMDAAGLERPVSDYFRRNVSATPSGVWSQRYLRWAIEMLGVERIMFSTDYPYRFTPGGGARRLLDEADRSK